MASFRGRYILGSWVPLEVQCRNGSFVPTAPDAAPTVTVYASGSDTPVVDSLKMPPKDKPTRVGYFGVTQHLTGSFAVGHYTAHYKYEISASARAHSDTFEIVAGGSAHAQATGLQFYRRPDSDWIVAHQDTGSFRLRRNPRLKP